MAIVTPNSRFSEAHLARKQRPTPQDEQPSAGRPINFRAPSDLAARLDFVAEALGLDVSNLVRMVLYENLSTYERRARQLKQETGG